MQQRTQTERQQCDPNMTCLAAIACTKYHSHAGADSEGYDFMQPPVPLALLFCTSRDRLANPGPLACCSRDRREQRTDYCEACEVPARTWPPAAARGSWPAHIPPASCLFLQPSGAPSRLPCQVLPGPAADTLPGTWREAASPAARPGWSKFACWDSR